jgi:hypothetical protein
MKRIFAFCCRRKFHGWRTSFDLFVAAEGLKSCGGMFSWLLIAILWHLHGCGLSAEGLWAGCE